MTLVSASFSFYFSAFIEVGLIDLSRIEMRQLVSKYV